MALLFVAPIAAVIGGCSLLWNHFFGADAASINFRNSEVLYAEQPATTTPAVVLAAAAASSTPAEDLKIPILVYHIVRPSYPTDSKGVKDLAQTPEVFDAQMQHLQDAGYHVITFGALENALKDGAPLPEKPIVLSFDDGWRDQYEYAFPILKKHNLTATFFVFTNPIGRKGFLTWDNLKEMRDAGMTIGSHSLSHPFLVRITDPAQLKKEVEGSKAVLEKELGITVSEFAYPFGQVTPAVEDAVVTAGYKAARGDYVRRNGMQSGSQIYELSALNAPTTEAEFNRKFP